LGNAFATIAVLAILVEVCVDILKSAIPFIHGWKSQLSSIVVGVLLATATATGLLHTLGIHLSAPWIDFFLTGLVISRGSNFFHDLLGKLKIN